MGSAWSETPTHHHTNIPPHHIPPQPSTVFSDRDSQSCMHACMAMFMPTCPRASDRRAVCPAPRSRCPHRGVGDLQRRSDQNRTGQAQRIGRMRGVYGMSCRRSKTATCQVSGLHVGGWAGKISTAGNTTLLLTYYRCRSRGQGRSVLLRHTPRRRTALLRDLAHRWAAPTWGLGRLSGWRRGCPACHRPAAPLPLPHCTWGAAPPACAC